MQCRVDPPTSLRKQNTPRVWRGRERVRIWDEFVGHGWEMFGHEGSEVAILSERQQVLLMQCVDVAVGVFFDDLVGNNQGLALVGGSQAIHAETVDIC